MEQFAKSITLNKKRARYYDLHSLAESTHDNAKRAKAHFYGGNGFTVGNYQPLLTELAAGFDISALAMRGYWYDKPKARVLTREQDADLLIKFLEQTQDSPVVGIGHSQGATATAMAAAKRPDLFSALYLIEPVTFTKSQALLYKLIPRRVKLKRQPFKSALTKQKFWANIDDFYDSLRELIPLCRAKLSKAKRWPLCIYLHSRARDSELFWHPLYRRCIKEAGKNHGALPTHHR